MTEGLISFVYFRDFPGGADDKESAFNALRYGFNPWVGKIPWRREWFPHFSIVAWRIPWTEEPGGLQSSGHEQKDVSGSLVSYRSHWRGL